MSKKILTYAMLVMSMFVLTACPSDDDDDNNDSKSSSNYFVGLWKGKSNMFFFDDGYFIERTSFSSGRDFLTKDSQTYKWAYDGNTKILSTSYNNRQWNVTMMDNNEWAGLDLGNSMTAVSFQKGSLEETFLFLLDGTEWVSEDHTRMSFKYGQIILYGLYGKNRFFGYYNESMCEVYSISEHKNSIVISGRTNNKEYFDLTIMNPYSYWDIQIDALGVDKTHVEHFKRENF